MPEGFVVGTFSESDALLHAVVSLRRERFRVYDVFAPYPIHGLDEAMSHSQDEAASRHARRGARRADGRRAFQFYTNVLDWSLDVGGKPNNSALAFFPICFELTVLFGGSPRCSPSSCGRGSIRQARAPRGRGRHRRPFRARAATTRTTSSRRAVRTSCSSSSGALRSKRRKDRCEPRAESGVGHRHRSASSRAAPTPSRTTNTCPTWRAARRTRRSPRTRSTRDGLTLQRPVPGTIARGQQPFHYLAGEAGSGARGARAQEPVPCARTRRSTRAKRSTRSTASFATASEVSATGPLPARSPPPPSYRSERLSRIRAGSMFHVVTMGAGKMPSYAAQLGVDDRWKIVAYVRTSLQGLAGARRAMTQHVARDGDEHARAARARVPRRGRRGRRDSHVPRANLAQLPGERLLRLVARRGGDVLSSLSQFVSRRALVGVAAPRARSFHAPLAPRGRPHARCSSPVGLSLPVVRRRARSRRTGGIGPRLVPARAASYSAGWSLAVAAWALVCVGISQGIPRPRRRSDARASSSIAGSFATRPCFSSCSRRRSPWWPSTGCSHSTRTGSARCSPFTRSRGCSCKASRR